VAILAILGVIVAAGIASGGQEGALNTTFWALVPPIIAIGLALITKEVYSSLFVGVVAGGLFYANFHPVTALDAIVNDGLISAVAGTAGIFAFLVILGAIVVLLNKAGGSKAFGDWAQTHVKTRVGALLATFALGVLIFTGYSSFFS
jgi:Na+/H+ antiporter NhaC